MSIHTQNRILEATTTTVVKYGSETYTQKDGGGFVRCFPKVLPMDSFGYDCYISNSKLCEKCGSL